MSIFTQAQLARLDDDRRQVQKRYDDLVLEYGLLKLSNRSALELANQGFLRRMGVLSRCVHNVFETIPPEQEGLPSKEQLRDCEINLHAFYVNLFGCFDNLALVWVHEHKIRRSNGKPLAPSQIGFGEKCDVVRKSLPSGFSRYMTSKTMTDWFGYLGRGLISTKPDSDGCEFDEG